MNKTGETQMNEIWLQLRYGQLFFIGLPRGDPLTPFSINAGQKPVHQWITIPDGLESTKWKSQKDNILLFCHFQKLKGYKSYKNFNQLL